ncbi:MAG: thiamine diphosphokinase, partial [Acidimicrobiia bacterium]|nr:thiamine diphosphokinase [Acidimicrobiia bacterium]
SMVSLLPYGGNARGVTLTGFVYGLDDEMLEAGSGRGLSNIIVGEHASISVAEGTLLAMFPDELSS